MTEVHNLEVHFLTSNNVYHNKLFELAFTNLSPTHNLLCDPQSHPHYTIIHYGACMSENKCVGLYCPYLPHAVNKVIKVKPVLHYRLVLNTMISTWSFVTYNSWLYSVFIIQNGEQYWRKSKPCSKYVLWQARNFRDTLYYLKIHNWV
jgi:hypothetical protein